MPYRNPRSKYWYAKWRDAGGRRVRRSTGTTDRKEAERLEAQWRHEAWQERAFGQPARHTWDQGAAAWLKTRRVSERDRFSLKHLRRHFGGTILNDLSRRDTAAYRKMREAEHAAPGTIIRELGALSRMLAYCRRELEWEAPEITQGVRPKHPPGRIRWLTRREYERLVEAASGNARAPWLADFIQLAVHTGMRRGELLGLEWYRVDLDRRQVYLEPEHHKGRRPDVVPLNAEAVAALKRLRGGTRWVFEREGKRIQSVKRSFATAVRDAKIRPCVIHDLRHTCAAWLVQSGVPIRTVAEVLRHRDITTTMRYAHLAPDDVHEAVGRMAQMWARSDGSGTDSEGSGGCGPLSAAASY